MNPVKRIKDAINNEDYLSAFSSAVTYFQLFSYILLARKLKGKIGSEKLEKLNVPGIIMLSHVLKIIDQPEYCTMWDVLSARNKLVHPNEGVMHDPTDEEKRALSKSILCIGKLLQKI
ncbi:hypothetical protein ISS40_01010 [Candidatus Bathyarchaeota archaeon]|nr:hypothetical protein [Candidatus Bathyarchaeota archaeon]